MYAVIETGGKQYRVEVGTELAVELLDATPGQSITIDRVLLVADGTKTEVGRPVVPGATVAAEVVRLDRADKVIAFKYRPKARRRVKKGHRQEQMVLRITDVVLNGKSAAAAAGVTKKDEKAERAKLEAAAARQAAADAALAAKLAETKPAAAKKAPAAKPAAAKPAAAKAAPAAKPAAAKKAPAAKPAAAKPDASKPAAKPGAAKAAAAKKAPAPKPAAAKPAATKPAAAKKPAAPKPARPKKEA
ncbi:MAG: hypothetical protein RL338_1171 [Chloroflexota bacterium]